MMPKNDAENCRKRQKMAEWHHRDLQVWVKAMALAGQIYEVTAAFPKAEMFGLTSQLRRAAVSIPSNIAEGCGRLTAGEMRQFFGQSRGSAYELDTQLRIAGGLSYLDQNRVHMLLEQSWEIARMLNALIKRLQRPHA